MRSRLQDELKKYEEELARREERREADGAARPVGECAARWRSIDAEQWQEAGSSCSIEVPYTLKASEMGIRKRKRKDSEGSDTNTEVSSSDAVDQSAKYPRKHGKFDFQ